MTIAESLGQFLLDNTAITAITSEIRPQVLPDDASYPALTYSMIDDERIRTLDGHSTLSTASFDIDCYAPQYAKARELADVVRAELDGYTGELGGHTAEQIDFDAASDYVEGQTKIYSVTMSVAIWYSEA